MNKNNSLQKDKSGLEIYYFGKLSFRNALVFWLIANNLSIRKIKEFNIFQTKEKYSELISASFYIIEKLQEVKQKYVNIFYQNVNNYSILFDSFEWIPDKYIFINQKNYKFWINFLNETETLKLITVSEIDKNLIDCLQNSIQKLHTKLLAFKEFPGEQR